MKNVKYFILGQTVNFIFSYCSPWGQCQQEIWPLQVEICWATRHNQRLVWYRNAWWVYLNLLVKPYQFYCNVPEACREEFHHRLKVYHAWKARHRMNESKKESTFDDGMRAPTSVTVTITQTGPWNRKSVISTDQRYFRYLPLHSYTIAITCSLCKTLNCQWTESQGFSHM